MTKAYYKSVATPVLKKMWSRLRDGLMSLPAEDRPQEDVESLIAMRDELDRRGGREPINVDFEKYLTD